MIMYFILWSLYIAVAVVTVWAYWLAAASSLVEYFQAIVYVLAPALAVLGGLLTIKEYGWRSTAGKIFLLITISLISWFIGEAVWTYYDLVLKIDPFPSLADCFYFIAYIPFCLGLIWQCRFLRTTGHKPLGYTQNLLLIIIVILFSSIALYFGVYKAIQPEQTILENIAAISYGLADVVLVLVGLVITIMTIEMHGGRFAKAWWWFLFGVFCTFIADITFAIYTNPYEMEIGYYKPTLDTIWIVGYLCMGYGIGQFGWLVRGVREQVQAQKKMTK